MLSGPIDAVMPLWNIQVSRKVMRDYGEVKRLFLDTANIAKS
jgi:hypothetical protein